MKFSHLHVHTQFSLLDGAAEIGKLYKKAINDGMPALAITDHGNMFGEDYYIELVSRKTIFFYGFYFTSFGNAFSFNWVLKSS